MICGFVFVFVLCFVCVCVFEWVHMSGHLEPDVDPRAFIRWCVHGVVYASMEARGRHWVSYSYPFDIVSLLNVDIG